MARHQPDASDPRRPGRVQPPALATCALDLAFGEHAAVERFERGGGRAPRHPCRRTLQAAAAARACAIGAAELSSVLRRMPGAIMDLAA